VTDIPASIKSVVHVLNCSMTVHAVNCLHKLDDDGQIVVSLNHFYVCFSLIVGEIHKHLQSLYSLLRTYDTIKLVRKNAEYV
jgi:hypothetical protein